MASLKFRHYATESALKGTGTVDDALNAFDVGTIVFIDDTQKQYIITSKSNNVVTYKIYYGKAAVVGVSRRDATLTLTFSDGSEIAVKINNVEHATLADTANTAKSVDWNNVSGKPTNFVTTDDTQTITGAKTFTNNVSLQGSTSADSITTEDLIVNGAARFVSGLTGDLKGNVVGNVTGNVTGNVSGSSGSCTGNALTATTLQTARSINGTSFNGSQAITTAKWGTARTITIADNTNEHTQANNSIDGGANFTLKLPATIKADIIGNASTADSAKSVDWANVINTPNLVTTDTEQTITGVKTFNNNTTFKNETDIESLTADSLLVTGSARFTNTINGNLKGNVEGNLTGNASTATTAATATEFSTNKAITLTGDITGSASSKGGWSVATTIADGAVTNAKLANSKVTIAGTAVSLGGSIAASTIGAALTTSAPAAYATNAGTATKAGEADKATKDSDGNVINTTYIKTVTLASGTNNGTLKLTVGGTTTDNIAVKGLGSAAYTDSESYAAASHIHNYAGSSSAGGAANWLRGDYTTNGGQQGPNYFGVKKVGALMMNTPINGNSQYKDFLIMDCYSNSDVGGAVAFGVNRQSLGAYIMRSAAERETWEESAELLGTHNYTSYTVKKDGTGASGTWDINISGNASSATKATNADRATGDSDGNTINTTYLKRSGGTVTGNVTFNSSVTADSITAEDLIVNGASRFVSGITGDLVGNVTGNVTGNLSGNASSATKAINDGSGNPIITTYATKTERANNDITAASLTATKLTLTRAAGNITANIPTWNQDTTGTAAKATADANGNNIVNTYATKAEVAALPKSMVIKGTLDASHALPTSGMTEGDTYIVGASGTYNKIACKVGDFFVRTSDGWLRVPAGDEWEYNENTIKAIKVNNAVHSDTAGTASAVAWTGITGIPDLVTTDAEQTITGNKSFKNNTSMESLTADSLLVTGPARFTNNIQGNLIGNVTGYLTGNISGSSTSCSGNADNATKDGSGNNIVNTYARIDKVYNDSSTYRQFLGKSGSSSDWVRTTESGIIPYTNGDASNGHSSLGTPSWYFSKAYIQNIYGYLNGNISGSSTSCSGNAATATKATQDGNGNIIASSYARKISLTAPESDYTDFVILLCSLDNTDISADLYCFGTLYLKRSNILSSQIQKVDICVGKNYNSTDPIFASLSASNAHPRPKLVTCTYEGKPYVALYFYIDGSSYTTPYFIGQCSDYTSLKCIKTYCNTTKDIINEEIYNSITPIVTTEVPYVFYGLPKVSKDHGATVEDIALVSSDITGNAATATTASSCSGNSATATKAGYLDTGTMTLYAHGGNEINFGGTARSDTIYFGYRAIENKPIPTSFIFGGSTGTATLTAGGFKKSNSSSSYVLTGDGGHAAISELSVKYATTSGACTGNAATATNADKLDGLHVNKYGHIYAYNKSVTFEQTLTPWYIKVTFPGYADWNNFMIRTDYNNAWNVIRVFKVGFSDGIMVIPENQNGGNINAVCYDCIYHPTENKAILYFRLNAIQDSTTNHYSPSSSCTVTIDSITEADITCFTAEPTLSANRSWSTISGNVLVTNPISASVNYASSAGSASSALTATLSTTCSGNSGTASKLETPRTIWGQSFDGSGNVSGSLTGVTNITASGSVFSNNYNASGNTAVAAFVFNKGGDYFGIGVSSGGVSNVGFGTTTNTTGTWKSEMMTITNSGNVGIGTTSPTSKLHVAGAGYFASDISSAANIIAGGYIKGETVKISSGCTLEYSSTDKCVRFVFN